MLRLFQCACIFEILRNTKFWIYLYMLLFQKSWRQLFLMLYLEHWMPLECSEMSRQTAHPTLRWWQQQYAEGRWCQAAGFPGDDGSFLQVARSVRLYSQHWCDRTNDRRRLGRDSASLGEVAKTPGCLWGCGWWGWAQGRGEELCTDRTGRLRLKEVLYHAVKLSWSTHPIIHKKKHIYELKLKYGNVTCVQICNIVHQSIWKKFRYKPGTGNENIFSMTQYHFVNLLYHTNPIKISGCIGPLLAVLEIH